jgi:hypothetical protein
MALQDDLLSIERELWIGEADAYRRNLDDDCLVAFTEMAGVSQREEVAGMVEGGPRWRELELEIEGFLRPTDEVAIVSYRASAVRGGEDRYRALVSSGYVRRGDEWKMMFHQQTPLPG